MVPRTDYCAPATHIRGRYSSKVQTRNGIHGVEGDECFLTLTEGEGGTEFTYFENIRCATVNWKQFLLWRSNKIMDMIHFVALTLLPRAGEIFVEKWLGGGIFEWLTDWLSIVAFLQSLIWTGLIGHHLQEDKLLARKIDNWLIELQSKLNWTLHYLFVCIFIRQVRVGNSIIRHLSEFCQKIIWKGF